jgi:hypothetical protein
MLLKLVSWMSHNCFCYPDTLKTTLHLALCIEYCSKQFYPLVQHAQQLHPSLVWICYKHHLVGVMKLHICCECYLKRCTYNGSIGACNSHFVSRGTNILLMWKSITSDINTFQQLLKLHATTLDTSSLCRRVWFCSQHYLFLCLGAF